MSDPIPTIKEIAKRLNVSVSTVSRALSDHPRISEKTKEAVKELARTLHYEPNSKAIFFKQKKSYVIGVIVPLIYEDFFSKGISGIESVAMNNGYTILFGQSYDSVEKERVVVDAMKNQRVDGLIISLSKETSKNDHLKVLDTYNIPVVYFDRVPSTPNVNKVYSNLFEGTVSMIEWLFKQGRKRIAFINGPGALIASKERLDGYIEGVSRRKLKVDMQMVEQTDFSEEGTHKAVARLLSLKKPPDAIISFNDYVHIDAVKYALKEHVKINDAILFASYANISVNKHTAYPPVISVDQFPYKQGEEAMKMMMELLQRKQEQPDADPEFHNKEMEALLVFN